MNIPSEIEVKVSPVYNPMVGVSLIRRMESGFWSQLSIQYSSSGFEAQVTPHSRYTRYRLTYINALPELGYNINQSFSAKIGFSIGTLLKAIRKKENEDWIIVNGFELFKRSDYGAVFGIDNQFNKFTIGICYYQGLKNIAYKNWNTLNGMILHDPEGYNRAFTFKLGYRIKL